MLISLTGQDGYRRAKRAQYYVFGFRAKYPHAPAMHFDMTEENALAHLREYALSVSIFDIHKLAVLHGTFEAKEPAALAKLLKSFADLKDVVIIVSEEKKAPAAFSFLKSVAHAESFEAPAGSVLFGFIKEEAKTRGIELDAAALMLLAERFGGDTWGIATELDRAALLGKTRLVRADFVDLSREEAGIEDLLYRLRLPLVADRLVALERILAKKYDPGMVFNRIAYRNPQKISAFADYDVLVKTGKLDYEEALLALAI